MKDPRLTKLESEWDNTVEQIEGLKVRASEAEDGKLNDEDQANYDALIVRATELKPQIENLRKQDELLNSVAKASAPVVDGDQKVRASDAPKDAGEFMFHFLRSMPTQHFDQKSQDMVYRALDTVDSTSNPGLLPYTIQGGIIRFVDAGRPCIDSLQNFPLPPGSSFKRRVETGAANGPQVAVQASEGAEIASGFPTVAYVDVDHSTYAGGLNLTLQAEAFTNPSVAQQNLRSLAEQYAIVTETAVAAALKTAASAVQTAGDSTDTPGEILEDIYEAADLVWQNSKTQADTIWVDTTTRRWLATRVGSDGHPAFPTINPYNRMGTGADANTHAGPSIAGLRVVTVPNFATDTFIVGASRYGEVYESMYPQLEAVAPSTLTRQIAMAGELGTYFRSEGFCTIVDADSGATPNFG